MTHCVLQEVARDLLQALLVGLDELGQIISELEFEFQILGTCVCLIVVTYLFNCLLQIELAVVDLEL